MLQHKPSCLSGPVSKTRRSWNNGADKPRPPRDESTIRAELVERVRREIAEGTYDTPEKMAIALDRLLNRLEWE
jgi:anti-sigma28 factor (negative regulator of flagellin synthesis)